MILELFHRKSRVFGIVAADGVHEIVIDRPIGRMSIRVEDYKKCLNIINKLGDVQPVFSTDPSNGINSVQELVRVEFSDRSSFLCQRTNLPIK